MTELANSLDWTGADGVTVTSLATAALGDQMQVQGSPTWSTDPAVQLWREGASVVCSGSQYLSWAIPNETSMLYTRFYAGRVFPVTDTVVIARWIFDSDPSRGLELHWSTDHKIYVRSVRGDGSYITAWISPAIQTTGGDPSLYAFDCMISSFYGFFSLDIYRADGIHEAGIGYEDLVESGAVISGLRAGTLNSSSQKIRIDEFVVSATTIGPAPPKPSPYDFSKVEVAQLTGSQLDRTFILDTSKLDSPTVREILPVSSVSINESLEEDEDRRLSLNPPTGTVMFSEWVDLDAAPILRAKKNARIEVRYDDRRIGPDGILLFVGIVRDVDLTLSSETNGRRQVKQVSTIQLGDLTSLWVNDLITLPAGTPAEGALDRLARAIGSASIYEDFSNVGANVATHNAQTEAYNEDVTRSRLEWIRAYTAYTHLTTMQFPSYDEVYAGAVLLTDSTYKTAYGGWGAHANLAGGQSWQTSVQYKFPVVDRSGLFPATVNITTNMVIYTMLYQNAVSFGLKPTARLEVPSGQVGIVKTSRYTLTPKQMTVSVELAEPINYTYESHKFLTPVRDF